MNPVEERRPARPRGDLGARGVRPPGDHRKSLREAQPTAVRDGRRVSAEDATGLPCPGQSARFGFDLIADFTCEFFKPYAVSFDYGRMRMSVGRSS